MIPEVAATVTAGVPNGGAGHGARSGHAKDSTLIPTTAHALTGEGFDASEDGTGRGTPLIANAFDARQSDVIQYGDQAGPLDTDGHSQAVWQGGSTQDQIMGPEAVSPTLAHSGCTHGGHHQPKVRQGMSVRRLTPRECERLQGFPDDYTAIPYRSKTASDGPRYKALGNSMAVPVVRWIGERIQAVEDLL